MSQNSSKDRSNEAVHGFLKIFGMFRWVWFCLFVITLISSAGYLYEWISLSKVWGDPPPLSSMESHEGVLINYETAKRLKKGEDLDENTTVPIGSSEGGAAAGEAKKDGGNGKDGKAPGQKPAKTKKTPPPAFEPVRYSGVHIYVPEKKEVMDFHCDFPSSKAIDTFTGEGRRGAPNSSILNTCDWVYREIALQNLCENCGNVTKLYGNRVAVKADKRGFVYELLIDGKTNLSYENMTKLYRQQVDKFSLLFSRFLILGLILLVFAAYGFHFDRTFKRAEAEKKDPAPLVDDEDYDELDDKY